MLSFNFCKTIQRHFNRKDWHFFVKVGMSLRICYSDMPIRILTLQRHLVSKYWIITVEGNHGMLLLYGHQHRQAVWTCGKDLQHGLEHADWIWTCSMDMEMRHGYGHAARTWKWSLDVTGNAALTWTCNMNTDIYYGHGQFRVHRFWLFLKNEEVGTWNWCKIKF